MLECIHVIGCPVAHCVLDCCTITPHAVCFDTFVQPTVTFHSSCLGASQCMLGSIHALWYAQFMCDCITMYYHRSQLVLRCKPLCSQFILVCCTVACRMQCTAPALYHLSVSYAPVGPCTAEIAEAALRILLQASSALRPADLSAALVHCARLDLKEDISAFAQRLTKEGNPVVNPAVPALAAMLANNQDLAHACFEASGELMLMS